MKFEEVLERDMIVALRACLMPEFEEAPTKRQKEMVWSYFRHISQIDQPTSYETTTNQLWLTEGKRAFYLVVKGLMEKELTSDETQGIVHDGRTSQHRDK